MKRVLSILLTILFVFLMTACKQNIKESDKPKKNIFETSDTESLTICSKEYVDEFMDILDDGNFRLDGLYGDEKPSKKNCYNVTPPQIAKSTDIKIFKFSDTCLSFALIENKLYSICRSLGGFGFVNAVPWDYDNDGNVDLLVASSWGSGLHRSEISVFNVVTKESIIIFDTLGLEEKQVDLIIKTVADKEEIIYELHTADVQFNDDNLADLSYELTGLVGTVELELGTPVVNLIK